MPQEEAFSMAVAFVSSWRVPGSRHGGRDQRWFLRTDGAERTEADRVIRLEYIGRKASLFARCRSRRAIRQQCCRNVECQTASRIITGTAVKNHRRKLFQPDLWLNLRKNFFVASGLQTRVIAYSPYILERPVESRITLWVLFFRRH